MPFQWHDLQLWLSLEEAAGKRCSECGAAFDPSPNPQRQCRRGGREGRGWLGAEEEMVQVINVYLNSHHRGPQGHE